MTSRSHAYTSSRRPKVSEQRAAEQVAAMPVSMGGCAGGQPHHWLIETPNGSYVGARCKRCPATREFRTAGADAWDFAL